MAPTWSGVNSSCPSGVKSPRLIRIKELPQITAVKNSIPQWRSSAGESCVGGRCFALALKGELCIFVSAKVVQLIELEMKIRLNSITRPLFMVSLVILGACSESDQAIDVKTNPEVNVTFTEVSGPYEKYLANIAIDGMACEMMCGSKIAGELNGLEGVKNTDIEFKGEGQVNFALVEFDANTVSEQEMIKAVQAIANGHYKVNSVEVKHVVAGAQTEEEEEKKVSAYKPGLQYQMPNIFSVFTRLF
jgi:copper chaperone CopZ